MSKRQSLLFSVLMALGMSFVMSFVMSAVNVGFVPEFASVWGRGFVAGFIAAVPAALLVAPIAHKVVRAVSGAERRTRAHPPNLTPPRALISSGNCAGGEDRTPTPLSGPGILRAPRQTKTRRIFHILLNGSACSLDGVGCRMTDYE